MIAIRPAVPADGPVIARIRAESWRAAYAGVVLPETLAELTAPEAVAREGVWRSRQPMDGTLMAEPGTASGLRGAGATGLPDQPGPFGFASYGPERSQSENLDRSPAEPGDREHAELYAIYVRPARWSSGAGRALLAGVLGLARRAGYHDISLWVLEANERARRFYERAEFQATGESVVLGRLGGITEVRYRRLIG